MDKLFIYSDNYNTDKINDSLVDKYVSESKRNLLFDDDDIAIELDLGFGKVLSALGKGSDAERAARQGKPIEEIEKSSEKKSSVNNQPVNTNSSSDASTNTQTSGNPQISSADAIKNKEVDSKKEVTDRDNKMVNFLIDAVNNYFETGETIDTKTMITGGIYAVDVFKNAGPVLDGVNNILKTLKVGQSDYRDLRQKQAQITKFIKQARLEAKLTDQQINEMEKKLNEKLYGEITGNATDNNQNNNSSDMPQVDLSQYPAASGQQVKRELLTFNQRLKITIGNLKENLAVAKESGMLPFILTTLMEVVAFPLKCLGVIGIKPADKSEEDKRKERIQENSAKHQAEMQKIKENGPYKVGETKNGLQRVPVMYDPKRTAFYVLDKYGNEKHFNNPKHIQNDWKQSARKYGYNGV